MELEKDQELSKESLIDAGEPIEEAFYLFNINKTGHEVLEKYKVDYNGLFILHLLSKGISVHDMGTRALSWLQGLIRKGFVNAEGTRPTLAGKLLYRQVREGKETVEEQKKETDWFEMWWKEAYPSTNYFEYKGKTFAGSQKKNLYKGKCKEIFNRYVNEETFSPEDIISATKFHIETVKKLSLQRGRNEMDYVPNSERYLREAIFAPYIAIYKKGTKTDKTNTMDL